MHIAHIVKKYIWRDGVLLVGVGVMLVVVFRGVFSTALLPGWDTLPHFYALQQMALRFIPQGAFSGYGLSWFGGYPLFLFYGPLFFAVTGLVAYLLPGVALTLIFRVGLLVTLYLVVVGLWYVTRVFFGNEAGKVAIVLSTLFVFYPVQYASLGIGAGGVFFMGLFDGTLGIALLLLWLGFLERMRTAHTLRSQRWYFLAALAALVGIVCAHTLSSFAAAFVGIIYVAYHLRDIKLFMRTMLMVVCAALITAPFIVPFLRFLHITSSSAVTDLGKGDAFLYVFPFDIRHLFSLQTLPSFAWWAVAFLVFVCMGVYAAVQQKKTFIPVALLGIFLILVHSYFYALFPSVGVHYYRFILVAYVFSIVIASYGVVYAYNHYRSRLGTILVVAGVVGMIVQVSLMFGLSNNAGTSGFELLGKRDVPYHWQLSSYGGGADGETIIKEFAQLPVERAVVEPNGLDYYMMFGSPHYFETILPLVNKQAVLSGLYTESSPLSDFAYSDFENIMQHSVDMGNAPISEMAPSFFHQPVDAQVDRLARLGVNYFLSWTAATTAQLQSASHAHDIFSLGGFHLFQIDNPLPLVYPSTYQPGVFINDDGVVPFRTVSSVLYTGTSTDMLPVVDGGTSLQGIKNIPLNQFSFIIVSATNMTPQKKALLEQTGKPVIVLSNGSLPLLGARPQYWFDVHNLTVLDSSSFSSGMQSDTLFSWLQLVNDMEGNKDLFFVPTATTSMSEASVSDSHLSFSGNGPTILNMGYAPYWHMNACAPADSPQCRVWRVTPDEMLVFANGKTDMSYGPDQLYYILQWISLATIIGLAGWGIWGISKK